MDSNVFQETVEVTVKILRSRPSALISDIDGTLSPIVASPEEAEVLPECRSALQSLASQLDLVALISGRTAAEARRMVGLDELLYVGNHGLERWNASSGYQNEAAPYEVGMRDLKTRLEEELRGMPDVRIEDKTFILALHYRGAPRPDNARRRILELLEQLAPANRFVVAEGKMVIEVRPPLEMNKGTVVEGIVRENRLRGAVFLGDDVTDVDAMRALRRLRHESNMSIMVIGVGGDEMPAALAAEAEALLPGPEAVAEFLTAAANALSA